MGVWANVTRDGYHCSMTVQEVYTRLVATLTTLYEPREARNIASLITEHITGFGNTSRIVHKEEAVGVEEENKLTTIEAELLTQKPVQYILNNAPFCGMDLYVDEHVLIPRPETEELAAWIIEESKTLPPEAKVLDIGTGSGCLAIAINKQLPGLIVYAADISGNALAVAKKNSEIQNATIHFLEVDILNGRQWEHLPQFDVIVSNPPYIAQSEAAEMSNGVLLFEPQTALFVPDKNPLLFYDAIASFGLLHLHKNGSLFFEINETFGEETVVLLQQKGYSDVELRKDMQGKNRMIKAQLP